MTNETSDGLAAVPAELGGCVFCGYSLSWRTDDIDGWIAHLYCVGCDFLGPISDFKYNDVEDAKADSWARWIKGRAALSHPTPAFDAAAVREAKDSLHQIGNMDEAEIRNEPRYVKELVEEALTALADHEPTSKTVDDSGEAVGCQQEAVAEAIRLVEYDMVHRGGHGADGFIAERKEVATIISALRRNLSHPAPQAQGAEVERLRAKIARLKEAIRVLKIEAGGPPVDAGAKSISIFDIPMGSGPSASPDPLDPAFGGGVK